MSRMLFVDDDLTRYTQVSADCRHLVRIDYAQNPRSAISQLLWKQYDLISLDWDMPDDPQNKSTVMPLLDWIENNPTYSGKALSKVKWIIHSTNELGVMILTWRLRTLFPHSSIHRCWCRDIVDYLDSIQSSDDKQ